VALAGSGPIAKFATGFPVPTPAVIPSNGIIDASQNFGTTNLQTGSWKYIPLDFKNPYVISWNLAIQRALPGHFTLDLAYVGNHGVRNVGQYNVNAVNTVAGIACGAPCQPEFPRTASTTEFFKGYSSMYNALQIKVDRRFNAGLGITTSMTWARGMSFQQGDDGGFSFYINERRNYARTDFDRAKTFVQSYVYDLPFGKGKRWMNNNRAANYVVGGWKISGILTMMSGTPFNVTGPSGLNAPGNSNTANASGPMSVLHGIGANSPWFDTTTFAPPTCVTVSAACPVGSMLFFGNTGRNAFSGPGFFDLGLNLSKDIQINERFSAQFRVEAFNATNTAQFSNPNAGCCTGNFGTITGTIGSGSGTVNGTGGGRFLQLGAKIMF
jgi:hypothetical protein